MSSNRRAVVWVHWGRSEYEVLLARSVDSVAKHVRADRFVISSEPLSSTIDATQVIFSFSTEGFMRKPEALNAALPQGYDAILFLDSDTVVLGDIEHGFAQATRHGVALCFASNYSLETYYQTDRVMANLGLATAGQPAYNSGVIFFRPGPEVSSVFREWKDIFVSHHEHLFGDQEALTLAMLKAEFNPYVLPKSFNLRGVLELVVGPVFVWHGRSPVPVGINDSPRGSRRVLLRGRVLPLTILDGPLVRRITRRAVDFLYSAANRGLRRVFEAIRS